MSNLHLYSQGILDLTTKHHVNQIEAHRGRHATTKKDRQEIRFFHFLYDELNKVFIKTDFSLNN